MNLVEQFLNLKESIDDRIYFKSESTSEAEAAKELYHYMMEHENMVPSDFSYFDDYLEGKEPLIEDFYGWYFEQKRNGLVEKDPETGKHIFLND